MSAWDEWYPLWFNVVLVQGDGFNLLVNTGPPDDLSPINDMWTTVLGERSRYIRDDDDRLQSRLSSAGLTPDDITHVVVTPFQLYTTGGLRLFRNAQLCVSKKGWIHYHTTHQHPHDSRWHSISQDDLVYLVTDAWDRVRLLDDEAEVLPGVRTWWTGAHHRASLAVEVDTDSGVVVASDAFFRYENVEDNRMLGITENMYEALTAYERTRRVADHIVPLYDPRVFERYPGGRITGAGARR
jgi:glyoxylase-like metal-dependent hydrolase (beta-lactamase superfamily II)